MLAQARDFIWIGLLGLAITTPLGACDLPVTPFLARYQLIRNDKPLGDAMSRLERLGPASARYRFETNANKGLAGFLGARVNGFTEFEVTGGRLRPRHYESRQKVSFSKRNDSADFDWSKKIATGRYRKKDWTLQLTGDEIDNLLINLRLMLDASGPNSTWSYRSVEKGEIRERQFKQAGSSPQFTPAGPFNTRAVERIHGNPKRRTVTWHAEQLQNLAVRVEQHKPDGDTLVMELVEYQELSCGPRAEKKAGD
jgi:hypothetical protein